MFTKYCQAWVNSKLYPLLMQTKHRKHAQLVNGHKLQKTVGNKAVFFKAMHCAQYNCNMVTVCTLPWITIQSVSRVHTQIWPTCLLDLPFKTDQFVYQSYKYMGQCSWYSDKATGWKVYGSVPGKDKKFFSSTECPAHLPSYSMSIKISFPKGRVRMGQNLLLTSN